MANRNKSRGTAFETLISQYLRDQWSPDIDRLPLSGAKDRGDIGNFRVGQDLLTLECKSHARMDLATWLAEARAEAVNYGAVAGVVVHKRMRKGRAEDQYVTLTLGDFLAVLRAAKPS